MKVVFYRPFRLNLSEIDKNKEILKRKRDLITFAIAGIPMTIILLKYGSLELKDMFNFNINFINSSNLQTNNGLFLFIAT